MWLAERIWIDSKILTKHNPYIGSIQRWVRCGKSWLVRRFLKTCQITHLNSDPKLVIWLTRFCERLSRRMNRIRSKFYIKMCGGIRREASYHDVSMVTKCIINPISKLRLSQELLSNGVLSHQTILRGVWANTTPTNTKGIKPNDSMFDSQSSD